MLDEGSSLRIALIDGSGHGEAAASAAEIAVESLRGTAEQPLTVALSRVHSVLHGTRGAAVSIVEIAGDRLLFCGIGNVEGRLLTSVWQRRLSPQRGIAGVVMPNVRVEEVDLPSEEWALLLYSDGVSHRISANWDAIAPDPGNFIPRALDQWGRLTDDATMVVVMST